jgi:hypothetical protein
MKKKEAVEIIKVSNTEDAVVFNFTSEKKKCRKCGDVLFGGEIEWGICDCCA